MPTFDNWVNHAPLENWRPNRSSDAARRIDELTTSIILYRSGTAQPAQNVRLDLLSPPSDMVGEVVTAPKSRVLITGTSTLNIRRDDRFYVADDTREYLVIEMLPTVGDWTEAIAEASNT